MASERTPGTSNSHDDGATEEHAAAEAYGVRLVGPRNDRDQEDMRITFALAMHATWEFAAKPRYVIRPMF